MEELIENKRRLLSQTRDHLLRMPNNKERVEKLDAYFNLLEFYENIMSPDEEICELPYSLAVSMFGDIYLDFDMSGKYLKAVLNASVKDCNDLSNNALSLYRELSKIIKTFKDNDFNSGKQYVLTHKCNHKKMMKLIYEFFKQLDPDLFNIYLKMGKYGNVFNGPVRDGYIGVAYNSTPIDEANIIDGAIQADFEFYLTLVHEVGHAYQYFLQRNSRVMSSMSPYDELTSHLLEKLFLDYLRDNYRDDSFEVYRKEDLLYYLNDLSASKVIFKMMVNKNFKAIDYYTLDYDCYVSPEKRNEDMRKDCGNIFKEKEINKDVNFKLLFNREFKTRKAFEKWQKDMIEKREIYRYGEMNQSSVELNSIKYALGRSFAICFQEKMRENYREGWKEYKEFITLLSSLPFNDVIEKYFDTELINNHVKTLIKSYH